jgi:hypothetical protein
LNGRSDGYKQTAKLHYRNTIDDLYFILTKK